MHRHLTRLLLAAGICTAALVAAATPSPAAAETATLSAEYLQAIGDIVESGADGQAPPPSICNPSGNSTLYYSATGAATGPYPGTFTETGTITLGPQNQPVVGGPAMATGTGLAGTVLTFEAQFEIHSGTTTISGTKTLSATQPSGLPIASTATCASFVDSTLTGMFGPGEYSLISGRSYFANVQSAYSATIDDGTTRTQDAGYSGMSFNETFLTGATCLSTPDCVVVGGANPYGADFASTGTLEPPPSTADCKVTYGGWIMAQNGDRASFTGQARSSSTSVPTGSHAYRDAGPVLAHTFATTDTTSVVCDGDSVHVYGHGTVDGGSPVSFRIDLTDAGREDLFRIVWAGALPYDSGVVPLTGGNVTVH